MIEDLINNVIDSRDALAALAPISIDSPQQHALRVNVGGIIAILKEQLDDCDYEHTLFICEMNKVVAEHYRRIYLDDVCERVVA